MYLNYEEYVGMGGGAPESAFPRFEAKARAHLDRITFGRLQNESPARDSVKFCMFDLINAVSGEESAGTMAAGREIASVSNDGVSLSFVSGGSGGGARASAARYGAIVRSWLANETTACGVPLLYAGVSVK